MSRWRVKYPVPALTLAPSTPIFPGKDSTQSHERSEWHDFGCGRELMTLDALILALSSERELWGGDVEVCVVGGPVNRVEKRNGEVRLDHYLDVRSKLRYVEESILYSDGVRRTRERLKQKSEVEAGTGRSESKP